MANQDRTWRAWIPDRDSGPEEGFDVVGPSIHDKELRGVAARAAEHHHAHRGGWESSWPIVFAVQAPDGRVDYFEVHREMVPEFHADAVKEHPTRAQWQRPRHPSPFPDPRTDPATCPPYVDLDGREEV